MNAGRDRNDISMHLRSSNYIIELVEGRWDTQTHTETLVSLADRTALENKKQNRNVLLRLARHNGMNPLTGEYMTRQTEKKVADAGHIRLYLLGKFQRIAG